MYRPSSKGDAMAVTRALYRGPAHVCVDMNDELQGQLGDFTGRPIREQFPALGETGLFAAMDAVYATGHARQIPWASVYDGRPGTMLILPWHDEDGLVFGVGLHFHPCGRALVPGTDLLLRVLPVSAALATAVA